MRRASLGLGSDPGRTFGIAPSLRAAPARLLVYRRGRTAALHWHPKVPPRVSGARARGPACLPGPASGPSSRPWVGGGGGASMF